MNTRVLRKTHLGILMMVLIFSSVARASQLNVVEAANRAVVDVGKVGETASKGKKGPVFVFAEYHTSRVGQLQIAIMLLRLYELYGVKTIGLEGAMQSTKPLNGQWFHTAGGPTAKSFREDVAVRMVAEGEISTAEFMTLLFSDVETYGIELPAEYDVKLEVKGSAQIHYLLAIAEQSLTQADIRRINEL